MLSIPNFIYTNQLITFLITWVHSKYHIPAAFTYLYWAIGKFPWLWRSLRSLVNFSFCLKSKYSNRISRNSDNWCWDKWLPGGNRDANCSRVAVREMLTRWDLSYTRGISSGLASVFVSATINNFLTRVPHYSIN